MKNKLLFGLIILILVIIGVFLLTKNKTPTTTSSNQVTPQITQTPQTANSITISNFSFNPASLTIPTGTTVTWTNQDSVTHSIKSDSFNSPDLNQGDKFEFTFNTKGTFNYTCSIHPSMRGTIIVE